MIRGRHWPDWLLSVALVVAAAAVVVLVQWLTGGGLAGR